LNFIKLQNLDLHRVCSALATILRLRRELPARGKAIGFNGQKPFSRTGQGASHYLAPVVRMLQRWLSDLLNLFFPDADAPDKLWSWCAIGGMVAAAIAVVALVTWS